MHEGRLPGLTRRATVALKVHYIGSDKKALLLWLGFGYMFVGVKLVVNGLAFILPTFLGYTLLAVGFWKASQRVPGAWRLSAQVVAGMSAILAPVTFPDLLRFSFEDELRTFDQLTTFRWYFVELVPLLTPLALWNVLSWRGIRTAMLMVVPVTALAWMGYYALSPDHETLALICSGWVVPLYLCGVFFSAHRHSE
jgi:hypothetical protein